MTQTDGSASETSNKEISDSEVPRSWIEAIDEHQSSFVKDGYVIARGLFTPSEVEAVEKHFATIAAGDSVPGYWEPSLDAVDGAIRERYPRVIMPHRWDDFTRNWLLDPRWRPILKSLLQDEAIAALTMFYFKPPGSAGQALHQDNFYLHVRPGTCLGAWMAVDPARTENGCLYVVPGSHRMEIMCPKTPGEFSTHLAGAPKGMRAIPVELDPGDVLLFHGNLIHGSPANRTEATWRRSLIGHYIPMSSTHVSKYYDVLFDMAGSRVLRELLDDGGPCGADFQYQASYGKWH